MNNAAPPAKRARTDARRVEGEGADGTDARRVEGEGGDSASDRTAADTERDESRTTTDGEPGPIE